MTFEEMKLLSKEEQKNLFGKLKAIRNKAKVTNFSATYKVGYEALARNANISTKESKKLLKIYWDRNSAILDVENECEIREVDNTRWLLNPISGFWYSLRNDKDKFSTLNQGSAVFVFDLFLMYLIEQGVDIPFQYHDEWLGCFKNSEIDGIIVKIYKAIELVNQKLKLNIEVSCSIETGKNYSETH